MTARQLVSVDVSVSHRLRGHYLPLPWPLASVEVGGRWGYDETTSTVVSASSDSISGLTYRATAAIPKPAPAQIATVAPPRRVPGPLTRDLDLPRSLDQRVRDLAHQLTDRVRSAYGKAEAIQQYLLGPRFTYDLDGAPVSADAVLTEFLLRTHRGYCVQFAGAMVVLAREAGIPARLAIGYTSGVRDASGRYQIRAADAHAWPELWFPELGWTRFEPTPPARGAASRSVPAPAPSTPAAAPGQDPGSEAAAGAGTAGGGSGQAGSRSGRHARRRVRPCPARRGIRRQPDA